MRRHRQRTPILWIFVAVLLAALLLFCGYWLLRLAFDIDLLDRSGWQTTDTGTQYFDYYGEPLTGWQEIDGQQFYFTPDGNLASGWQEIGEKRYYFSAEGTALTGWRINLHACCVLIDVCVTAVRVAVSLDLLY